MRKFVCAAATLWALWSAPAQALQSVLVGSGFDAPVFLSAPTRDARLFVVEKGGLVKVISGGTTSTFLDLRSRVDTGGERGLLGLAFDPDFATNGRFYVDYIDRTTLSTVVSAFTAPTPSAGAADPLSEQQIISIAQPAGRSNHKAGWIGFRSTDPGQLYIATGDGGSSNDPNNFAQNLSSNLGKILRVTPGASGGYTVPTDNPFAGPGVAGNDEIWAYGLRNPYRNSFDRATGNFWIADVGQGTREEIDFESASTPGGRNYGWRPLEGSGDNPGVGDPAPAGATLPLFDYTHASGLGASIIGGYVYRGGAEPGLDGSYFFGDFVSGRIFSLDGGAASGFTERTAQLGTPFGANTLTSFGEDGLGNLYAMGLNGNVYRIAAAVPEPETWAMMVSGLLLVAAGVRRQRARARRS